MRNTIKTPLKPGDCVVYRKPKASTRPGPRAERITPTPRGEDYQYVVEKYWTVEQVSDGGDIVVRTRRGKRHTISPDDPRLRKANLFERLFMRGRFAQADA
jgi:hypothetical protein